jgi:hypothetical protein
MKTITALTETPNALVASGTKESAHLAGAVVVIDCQEKSAANLLLDPRLGSVADRTHSALGFQHGCVIFKAQSVPGFEISVSGDVLATISRGVLPPTLGIASPTVTPVVEMPVPVLVQDESVDGQRQVTGNATLSLCIDAGMKSEQVWVGRELLASASFHTDIVHEVAA